MMIYFFKGQLILLTLILISCILLYGYYYQSRKKYGVVIILNGPSAVGKTSIQKELQKILYKPYLAVGIDSFFCYIMPSHYMGGTPNALNMPGEDILRGEHVKNKEGHSTFKLTFYPESRKVIYGMHSAIAAYAKEGNNLIVDYIAYEPEWINDLQKKLKTVKNYWIKVTAPLSVLEERELNRGTSPKGHTRSHYDNVFGTIAYDFEIDSSAYKPQEIAQKIKDALHIS